jgi:hypothetical protein
MIAGGDDVLSVELRDDRFDAWNRWLAVIASLAMLAGAGWCATQINSVWIIGAPLLWLLTPVVFFRFAPLVLAESIRFDSDNLVRRRRFGPLVLERVIPADEVARFWINRRGWIELHDVDGEVLALGRFVAIDPELLHRLAAALRAHLDQLGGALHRWPSWTAGELVPRR